MTVRKNFNGSFVAASAIFMAIGSSNATSAWGAQDIGVRSNTASAMLNRLPFEQAANIVYVNAAALKEQSEALTLQSISDDIIAGGQIYFIDFSTAPSLAEKEALRKDFQAIVGVKFPTDWLVMSEHNEQLMYSPLSSPNDPILESAVGGPTNPLPKKRRPRSVTGSTDSGFPHKAFYINVNRPITREECTFPKSWNPNNGNAVFCDNASIALKYKIHWMRSLKHGTSNSTTPDAKLVRISIDSDASGAGINLNNRLVHLLVERPGIDPEASEHVQFLQGFRPFQWYAAYTTSAIAKDYSFSIEASNATASILKTFPISNINSSYQNQITSSFEVGGAASLDGILGPKATLEARATYSQSRTLSYDTQDYRVVRLSEGDRKITFKWERERCPTAETLLARKSTAPLFESFPKSVIDETRIAPVSYAGFVPNFDVVYAAAPDASGSTDFTIKSSVNIWPITSGTYERYYIIGLDYLYYADEAWQNYRRIEVPATFNVDWDHSIFTGGRPVNIQLGNFNGLCLSGKDDGTIEAEKCNLTSKNQSFLLDQYSRYVNVHTKTCFDGRHLNLQTCDESLSQRWKWRPNSDHLENEYYQANLAHNVNDGSLAVMAVDSSDYSTRTLSVFTDILR